MSYNVRHCEGMDKVLDHYGVRLFIERPGW